jgi:type VI secretion system protein ImpG
LNGIGLSGWKATALRFFLGDDYPAACDLYLLLMRYLKRITITADGNDAAIELPSDSLKPVGFADKETILNNETGLFPGHQILQEYFLFHDKFLFIDLTGLDKCKNLGEGCRFVINFELANNPLVVPRVTADSFVLFATPVINLFPHKAKALSFISELKHQEIRPTGERSANFRLYSVDQVKGLLKKNSENIVYEADNPLRKNTKAGHICHITQSKSPLGDDFDTYLSIPCYNHETGTSRIKLDIDLTCTNGILPEQLGICDICTTTRTTPESVEPANIKAVTAATYQGIQQNRQWKLLSGFSLNRASLDVTNNFRATLRLFINTGSRHQIAVMANSRKIDAIESIDAKPANRLIGRRMYRGYDIRLKLSGCHFAGPGGLYLFSAVLERFLGGYVTQNCFIRLVVEEIDKGYQFEWPSRMGDRCVL